MKYLMLALNGLKKKKGDAVAMLFLIGFATVMMYIGISVFSNMNHVLDEVNHRNNGADVILASQCESVDLIEKTMADLEEVKEIEISDANYVFSCKYQRGNEEKEEMAFLIESMNCQLEFFTPEIINKGAVKTENAIVLPYYLHVAKGYETGDIIQLEINQVKYECEIYGFMEDILFATPTNISVFHVWVSEELYEKMSEQALQITSYRVRLNEGEDAEKMEGEISAALEKKVEGFQQCYNLITNYETMRFGDTLTANIIMAILIVFAFIILFVAVVIVCFSIQNSLERNMTNTGIMEASGFTTNQLIGCTVLESFIIAVIGIILALAVSPLLSESVGGIIASSIGVHWCQNFDIRSAAITGVTILIFVLFATYVKARRYKKISILDALRGGVKTHNFRRNHVALDKTFLPLNIALGIKGILNQKKKSFAICFITIVLTMACNMGFFLYQNFVESSDNLLQLVGIERATTQINIPEGMDIHEVGETIEALDCVEQVGYYMTNNVKIEKDGVEESFTIDYWEDTSKLKTNTIVEGRYPTYDNEIVLSRLICENLNVKVGDMVNIISGDQTEGYLVVGMTQHISYLGKKAVMTFEGIQKVNETVKPSILMVYKTEGVEFADMEKEIREKYPDLEITDVEKIIESTCESIAVAMSMLCIVFNVCTVLIIIIIMFLMIRMKLTQEKARLGVDKALGFTTMQLITRVVMNYVPVAFVGSIIGAVISYFLFEPIVSLSLSFCGIRSCNMERGFVYMLLTVCIITVTSAIASFLISVKIRKIEPSRMIRE